VSLENVDVTSLSYVRMSAVYGIARVGPSGLPCGTPASMVYWLDVVALHLTAKTL